MILTAKGWSSVIALIYMALEKPNQVVALQDIADSQKISINYLRQLFIKMDEAGLVARKAAAKYVLAQDPNNILIKDVMLAVGESLKQYHELIQEEHQKNGKARLLTEKFQSHLYNQMYDIVEGVSLMSVINNYYISTPDVAPEQQNVALKLVSSK